MNLILLIYLIWLRFYLKKKKTVPYFFKAGILLLHVCGDKQRKKVARKKSLLNKSTLKRYVCKFFWNYIFCWCCKKMQILKSTFLWKGEILMHVNIWLCYGTILFLHYLLYSSTIKSLDDAVALYYAYIFLLI